ncbi:DNA mismatch repair endonuclease MutL [Clostridium aestuarii]|uniref:DNA mismatch repair protein MutL n=1 Tax=Clostridium aestuarii TaxID=338193 RepID=A0ABT4D0M0_9CLOT|nr:DNA mismatch repair endonuclease MutL [Clostridium aestuarii]MCY6483905.1 DNA mismatch repair endonuclease MutL [Clostridium aestuarii]
MKRINLLNNETSNKIAAGEVVERPSSIVKELIENSIDANAKNITIEIVEGGKTKIKITDDGEGIHPDDIEKAFMPHGTSKISRIDDIYSIRTFGFRGEALPSIAAVSNISLKSRTTDIEFGKEILISGGKIEYIKDVGCNIGTTIEVNDVFFNVPARKKFLKSTQRESSLISSIVNRLALANHNISFTYYSNNKRSLSTFESNDVKDTIRSVYGKNVFENIMSFEKHGDIASAYGYIGNAEISRGSRNNQSIFVNKRYIKSPLITAAVENAFKSFLTVNKHPFFVLFLEIYPEFIDVNVHPTKSEIKFEDERIIYKLVFDAVHKAIGESVRDTFDIDTESIEYNFEEKKVSTENNISDLKGSQLNSVQIPIDLKGSIKNLNSNLEFKKDVDYVNDVKNVHEFTKQKPEENLQENNINQDKQPAFDIIAEEKSSNFPNKSEEQKTAKFSMLNIIGQFNNTYILAQSSNEFYMIDQHAAHEKVLFEKYKSEIENSEVVSQILITPVVLELSSDDYSYYAEHAELFKETGFNIEDFGEDTISIREVPILLGKADAKKFFLEILDNIKNMGTGKTTEVKYNTIASLSCKAAIKANHSLSIEEMLTLIEQLRYLDEPFNCPHGRPTIIKMSLKDIEKKFKRIQ